MNMKQFIHSRQDHHNWDLTLEVRLSGPEVRGATGDLRSGLVGQVHGHTSYQEPVPIVVLMQGHMERKPATIGSKMNAAVLLT
jgi:hypothetical protein